jgi:hypothetical protein
MLRLAFMGGAALVASSSALAGAPLVRTLATGREIGKVMLETSTTQLRSQLWVQRTGGAGTARGSGDVSCRQNSSNESSGSDEMFAFTLPPNSRETVWRFAGTGSCVVTVSISGQGRLNVALRGY